MGSCVPVVNSDTYPVAVQPLGDYPFLIPLLVRLIDS